MLYIAMNEINFRCSPPSDVRFRNTQQVQCRRVEFEETAAVDAIQSQQLQSARCPQCHACHSNKYIKAAHVYAIRSLPVILDIRKWLKFGDLIFV